jgi:hypothetical protein
MPTEFKLLIIAWGLYALAGLLWGLKHSRQSQTNQLSPLFLPLGAFVWADAVVFGLFWLLVVGLCLLIGDWLLFLLIGSVFWAVRSLGEMIYWLNEQFSTVHRNPPEKFKFLFKFFPNDSVWFVYQIFWQCVLVISLVVSVKLFSVWLR